MTKKLLQQLKKLSIIIFTDKEYDLFISSIICADYVSSLEYLKKIEDKLLNKLQIGIEDNELLMSEYRKVDYLEKVVLEQSLKNNTYGKGIGFKKSIRRKYNKSV